jgi:hypothetical protein
MIEIVVDRDKENLQNGATFYFEKLDEDFIKFIDICFRHSKNRELVEIREVEGCKDI